MPALKSANLPACVLGIFICVSGVMKVVWPTTSQTGSVDYAMFGVGVAEVMIGIASFTMLHRFVAMLGICGAVVGIAWALWFERTPCGCLGRLATVSRGEHLVLSGVLGFLSVVVLTGKMSPRR